MAARKAKTVDRKAASRSTRPPKKKAAGAPAKKRSGYQIKTKATGASVESYLAAIPDANRRKDARTLVGMMRDITGEPPKMWGPSIVGFGRYHYKYASGHEGDMCVAAFSPRSTALVLYVTPGFERYGDLMKRLGKHTTGKCCLYVKRLDDVDTDVLREVIAVSTAECRRLYPS